MCRSSNQKVRATGDLAFMRIVAAKGQGKNGLTYVQIAIAKVRVNNKFASAHILTGKGRGNSELTCLREESHSNNDLTCRLSQERKVVTAPALIAE